MSTANSSFVSTRNACKLCTPLGACLAFRGVEDCLPFLHGSQGCATYIRRYTISHFREPMDIASSSFGEAEAIYGGKDNLHLGLENVIMQYRPSAIGLATTCLAETIGDDLNMFLHQFRTKHKDEELPAIIPVSTASYKGTHIDGFHSAVREIIKCIALDGETENTVNLLSGMVSPEDIRYMREFVESFGVKATVLPDYSDSLDAPTWSEYKKLPEGGTTIAEIKKMGCSKATIEFGESYREKDTGGSVLKDRFDVPNYSMGLPVGVKRNDKLVEYLSEITGQPLAKKYEGERGRLIDSYVDGHKYVFGKKAIVYGEEDLVLAIATLLGEIGMTAVLCASGGNSGKFKANLEKAVPEMVSEMTIMEGADFAEIEAAAAKVDADMIIGNSKGFTMSRHLEMPLVRVGFPIHDRIGGHRLQHIGYRGTQQLFDRITNTAIDLKQTGSPVGYTYM